MFDEAPFPALINVLHYSFAQYRRYQARFATIYNCIIIDLGQLALGTAADSMAHATIIFHCLQMHIPVGMLATIFQLDEPTLRILVAGNLPAGQPPLRCWKIICDIADAQETVNQLAMAAEAVKLAIYDLAGVTLHDAIRRDAMICHCYAQGIALPMIAVACGESPAAVAQILRQHGHFSESA